MFSAVCFDFDGVLVNSRDFHLEHIKSALGVDFPPQLYYDVHKGNFHEKVSQHEDIKNVDWIEYHRRVHQEEIHQPIHPYLLNLIPELAKGAQLFVVSSGVEKGISGFLEHHELAQHFEAVLGHESGLSKKKKFQRLEDEWNIDLEKTAFVTDTVGDIKEAQHFPITIIAVDFGYHTRQDLGNAKPHHVCSSWEEVEKVISLDPAN